MVAMRYARSHPQRVERLILASTSARRGEAQRAEAERVLAARADEPWYAGAMAALESDDDAYQTAEATTQALKTMAPLFFARWDAAASEFVQTDFGIDCVDALRLFNADPPDLLDDLGRISAPTLVITGEDDFVCGPASAAEIAGGISRARLVVLRHAGHMTYFEQPERFRAEVHSFLVA
jgi:proline iminopeptidase